MPQTTQSDNVLDQVFEEAGLLQKIQAIEARHQKRIKDEAEAKNSFKNCDRCKTKKVHNANSNYCLPCSYS